MAYYSEMIQLALLLVRQLLALRLLPRRFLTTHTYGT